MESEEEEKNYVLIGRLKTQGFALPQLLLLLLLSLPPLILVFASRLVFTICPLILGLASASCFLEAYLIFFEKHRVFLFCLYLSRAAALLSALVCSEAFPFAPVCVELVLPEVLCCPPSAVSMSSSLSAFLFFVGSCCCCAAAVAAKMKFISCCAAIPHSTL